MPIIDWLFAVDIEILCIGSTNPLIGLRRSWQFELQNIDYKKLWI